MKDQLSPEEMSEIVWDPRDNHDAISLVKQPDGNWRGFTVKNGQLIQARQNDPNIVLTLLMTHD